MFDVVGTKKVEEGIVVMWNDSGAVKYETYNFQDLIDMNVNSLNLIDRPTAYQVDPKTHKIGRKT
ncbi:MAG: hypothetical protein GYA23_03950 [Methanomicrobiales archaeon]|nr:hypothetical protein [Methanomicrobiales archaeon]